MIDTINWTNITDPQSLAQAPNTVTGGWFWTAMIYLVFVVAVLGLSAAGLEAAALVAAFVVFVGSIYLAYAHLISWWVTGSLVGIMLIVGTIIYYGNRR